MMTNMESRYTSFDRHSINAMKLTVLIFFQIPSLSGQQRKSGQLSGITKATSSPQLHDDDVVHEQKGKLISRTLIRLKEGNLSSQTISSTKRY